MDCCVFVGYDKDCYFDITDTSLIKQRLDDVIMDFDGDENNADQFFLNDVSKIKSAIMQLVSFSLIK